MTAAAFLARGNRRAADTCDIPMRDGVPAVDYHAHIAGAVALDQAIAISKRRGVKLGVLKHAGAPGHDYQISNDDELRAWVRETQGQPVFTGIEAESTDWASVFSKSAVAMLDYVQADCLSLLDPSGAPMRMWEPDFRVADAQSFMDRYVDFHVQRITNEPLDILVMPTFLPASLAPDADRLWTAARMDAIITAAVRHRVALEIDSESRIPRFAFLERAKAAGVTFAFGSNAQTAEGLGNLSYCTESYRRLGLTLAQFFCPRKRA